MRIVVDASVMVAALMANGAVRDVLLNSPDTEFFAPAYLKTELEKNIQKISTRSRLPVDSVVALIEDVSQAIEFVPLDAYVGKLAEATRLAERSGARGDEDYIALAVWLGAPIWALDNDFRRVPGLTVHSTEEIDLL